MGRKDNTAEMEFLYNGLNAFLQNKDLEQISIVTDSAQIAISRNAKQKGEVSAIGFQYEEESEDECDCEEVEQWKKR